MSTNNKQLTDLPIPIGRPQSSTSSLKTKSSAHTASASTIIKSESSTPTTISSKKSASHSTPQKPVGTASPSGVRYTISSTPRETQVRHREHATNETPERKRPNSVHIRQSSRDGDIKVPSSPIEELTLRLSKATGTVAPRTDLFSRIQADRPSTSTRDRLINSRLDANTTKLYHHKELEIGRNPADPTQLSHSRNASMSAGRSTPEKPASALKAETFPMNLTPPHLLRSHSRSSSQSDRSCPPASFPTDFYAKIPQPRPTHKSLQRANSARTHSLTSSPRSTSPLKRQVTDSETPKAMAISSRPIQSRARSFDIGGSQRLPITPSRNSSKNSLSSSISNLTSSSTQLHYYTTCLHTSPPCTRPLNVQPVIDQFYEPPRSTLAGSCFDCETSDRRERESSVLAFYNPRINAHKEDLAIIMSHLESRLESVSPISPLSPTGASSHFQSLNLGDKPALGNTNALHSGTEEFRGRQSSQVSSISDSDEDGVSVEMRIQVLEDRIVELTHFRDREVREVWHGYPQKWGPGTLGLIKGIESDQMTIRTIETGKGSRMSSESGRSQVGRVDGRMKVDWIREGHFS